MSLQVIQEAVGGIAQSQAFRFNITDVSDFVRRSITDNPRHTASLITSGILAFTPAAITTPFFAMMGFGASGPVAGEWS